MPMLTAQFGSKNVQHMQHNEHISRLIHRENYASFLQQNQIFEANTPSALYTTSQNILGVALTYPSIDPYDYVIEVAKSQDTLQTRMQKGAHVSFLQK